MNSIAQSDGVGCPLLDLPGELRNRIYNYTLEENIIRLVRGPKQEDPRNAGNFTNRQFFSLTQVCRCIRSEFSPLYKAQTRVSPSPQDLYAYIDTFLALPGIDDDKIMGFVILDFDDHLHSSACIDIKPLLLLLEKAKSFHVIAYNIIRLSDLELLSNDRQPTIQNVLADLYDIQNMDMFYEYMNEAMTALELDFDDVKGVEIIFELSLDHWEPWMGEWSKPDHDPNYRIPIELEENVLQWGRRCGMELDRSAGSHLTVNFRQEKRDGCSVV